MGCSTSVELHKLKISLNKAINKGLDPKATPKVIKEGEAAARDLVKVDEALELIKQQQYFNNIGVELNDAVLRLEDDFQSAYESNPEYIKLQEELQELMDNKQVAVNKVIKATYYSADSKFGKKKGEHKDSKFVAERMEAATAALEDKIQRNKDRVAQIQEAQERLNTVLNSNKALTPKIHDQILAEVSAKKIELKALSTEIALNEKLITEYIGRGIQATKNLNAKVKAGDNLARQKLAIATKIEEIEAWKESQTVAAKILDETIGKKGDRLSNFLKPRIVYNRLKSMAANIAVGFKQLILPSMSIEDTNDMNKVEDMLNRMIGHLDSSIEEYMDKTQALRDIGGQAQGEGSQSLSQLLLVDGELTQEVKVAIAVSSLQWLADNEASRASVRNEKGLRSITGIATGPISLEQQNAVSDIDVLATAAANSLGASISKLIGLSADVESDPQAALKLRKLENEMGLIGLHALGKSKLITLKKRRASNIFLRDQSDKIISFVQYTATGNKFIDAPGRLASKANRILTTIFGTDSRVREPRGSEARDKVFKNKSTIQNKHTTVSPTVQKGLNRARNVKWKWKDDFVGDIFVMLDEEGGREQLEAMLGYVDPATKHNRYAKALESENNRIKREVDQLEAARASSIRKGEPAIFLDYFFGKNGRLYVESNTFNPQLSKLHMLAVMAKSPKVKTQRDIDMYDVAMAGTFGVKIDKLTMNESIEGNEGILSKWNAIEEVLKDLHLDELNITEAIESIDKHNASDSKTKIKGYGPMLIAGITEYRKYAKAKRDSKDGNTVGVQPSIIIEVDGVTNGYILKAMQLPVMGDFETMKGIVQSGGVMIGTRYDSKPKLTKYQEFVPDAEGTGGVVFEYSSTAQQIADPSTNDAYEAPAAVMDDKFKVEYGKGNTKDASIKRVAELMLDAKLGALDGTTDTVPTITRDFMKPPFMTFNYGAGITGILEDMADTAIDKVYGLLENIHALDNTDLSGMTKEEVDAHNAERKATIEQLESILRANTHEWVKGNEGWEKGQEFYGTEKVINELHTAISNGETLSFTIPTALENNIKSSIKAGIGDMLKDTFKMYKPFVQAAGAINKSFQVMFKLFKRRLDKAIQYREGELGRPLTDTEVDGIVSVLKDSMPAIKVALAEGVEDRLIIMNDTQEASTVREDVSISGQTKYRYSKEFASKINQKKVDELTVALKTLRGEEYNKAADQLKRLQQASFSSQARQYALVEAMAAGAVIPIHFIDGTLQAATLATTNGMGNHDAVYESPTQADSTSRTYDKTMAEVMSSYSLSVEILDSLISSINAAEDGDVKSVNEELLKNTTNLKYADTIQSVLSNMTKVSTESEKGRSEMLSRPIRYDHLANEGGHYDWNMDGKFEYKPKTPDTSLVYKFSSKDDVEHETVTFALPQDVLVNFPKSKKASGKGMNKQITGIMKVGKFYVLELFDKSYGDTMIINSDTGTTDNGKQSANVGQLDQLMDLFSFNKKSSADVSNNKSNESTISSSTPFTINNPTGYQIKDAKKFSDITKLVAFATTGSTAKYATENPLITNTGVYIDSDIVGVSLNGISKDPSRDGYNKAIAELNKAIKAGATIVADTKQDRERAYNKATEGELAKYLVTQGYVESVPGNGVWNPTVNVNKTVNEAKSTINTPETIYITNKAAREQAHIDRKGVLTTRITRELPGIINMNKDFHFGNPFPVEEFGGKPGDTGEVVSKRFKSWLEGKSDVNIEPHRRDWINNMISSGSLDNVPLIYWKKVNTLTHDKVLADMIASNKSGTMSESKTNNSHSEQANGQVRSFIDC